MRTNQFMYVISHNSAVGTAISAHSTQSSSFASSPSPLQEAMQQDPQVSISSISPLDNFWSIPPIQDALDSYLTQQDLLQCIQVSKTLHDAFIPFLWRDVEPSTAALMSRFFESDAQVRHRHHVRTFRISAAADLVWKRNFSTFDPLPNLTDLAFNYPYLSRPTEIRPSSLRFLAWLGAHPKLERLEIRRQGFLSEELGVFAETMAQLTHLRELSLSLKDSISCSDLASILGACSGVEKLTLRYDLENQPSDAELLEMDLKMTFIKDLKLLPYEGRVESLLTHFLGYCPLLERLEVKASFSVSGSARKFVLALQRHCPRLQDLDLYCPDASQSDMTKVLEGCPSLKRLEIWVPRSPHPILYAMVNHHGQTLEALQIYGNRSLTLDEFSIVTGSCPLLKTLNAPVDWALPDLSVDGLDVVIGKPWVCTGLTTLRLLFVSNALDRELGAGMDILYQQIGRMTQLEDLTLDASRTSEEFTLAFIRGFEGLDHLKNVRDFYFSDCKVFPLGMELLGRILDQWPRLESFCGLTSLGLEDCEDEGIVLLRDKRAKVRQGLV